MSKLSLLTRPTEALAYTLDKKTGTVTMPNGKTFNPYTNENVDNLSLEELRVYNLERPPVDDTEAELEALAEAALAAQQAEKAATLAAKSATDAFRKALEAAGKLNADNKAVGIVRTVIYPTKRFDETTARAVMTKKLAKECEKTVLDTAKVKANVSPADYERMQITTGFTLKLSLDTEQA